AHSPWTYDVRLENQFVEDRIGNTVVTQRPPVSRNSQHDGATAIMRVILEKLYQFQPLLHRIFSIVIKTEPPNRDDRLARVSLIGRIFCNLHFINEELPIVHHPVHLM